jgi:DNA-binding XRE family transcriptional regulator
MQDEQTNFDRYVERKLGDPVLRLRSGQDFRARFEAADQAWDIALQLAALRQARGLTQKQVAEMLGTKQQAIARLENPAYTGHSLSMVRKYVEALGASLDVTVVPVEATDTYAAQRSPKPLLATQSHAAAGT